MYLSTDQRRGGRSAKVIAAVVAQLALTAPCFAHDNGVARTPPMGWNTFEAFVGEYDDAILRGNIDALVSTGLRDVGYTYFNLDGGWWQYKPAGQHRDAQGNLRIATTAAGCEHEPPCMYYANGKQGLLDLANYARGKGLKFGIYLQPTEQLFTCNYLQQDVELLKYLGVAFLKYDGYTTPENSPCFPQMRDALLSSGLQVVYSVNATHAPQRFEFANMWRTAGDISNDFQYIMNSADSVASKEAADRAGPGAWNDPDMLVMGNEDVSVDLGRLQLSLWSIVAAPLLISTDLRNATPETIAVYANTEVIAVNQDPLGKAGYRVSPAGNTEVWARELSDGGRAVVLLNRGMSATNVTAQWSQVGAQGSQTVRDLWAHANLGTMDSSFTANVPPQGVVMVKIGGSGIIPPSATGGAPNANTGGMPVNTGGSGAGGASSGGTSSGGISSGGASSGGASSGGGIGGAGSPIGGNRSQVGGSNSSSGGASSTASGGFSSNLGASANGGPMSSGGGRKGSGSSCGFAIASDSTWVWAAVSFLGLSALRSRRRRWKG
ncbi:MAG: hypothetical protein SFV15_25585 [Polyangiaceae bacterium]|nr:hypothetical protein [Polyangiaceae bacterium]